MDNRPTIAEVQEWVLKLYNTCEQTITSEERKEPVSYTHLDVYKRQPHSNAFALLAKVDDEGKVEALLEALKNEQICTELKSESGCTCRARP